MRTRTQGTCLRFYMHENRRHNRHGILLYEWLLEKAKALGLHGGTAYRSIAAFGRHRVMHEQHFFELAGDQPVRVDFVVSADEMKLMLDLIESEKIRLFYVAFPVEFGVTEGDT